MTKSLKLRPLIAALALCTIHPVAHAIKLGEPVVLSRIGEPLHVKIPVIDTMPEELGGLTIHMANTIGYTHAQVVAPAWLSTASVKLEKRDGIAMLDVKASKQHESIVDLVFELRWAAGRMLQTVPVFLDPADASSTHNITPIETSTTSPSTKAASVENIAPREQTKASIAQPSTSSLGNKESGAVGILKKEHSQKKSEGQLVVKRGDTLNKLVLPSVGKNVTLEQLLVAYTKANPHAFIKGNMNHLKSGVILKQPTKEAVQEIDSAEARKIVIAQSVDFSSYSAKLAEQVRSKQPDELPHATQKATGKITAKVQDSSNRGEVQDKLRLSSSNVSTDNKTAGQTGTTESIEDQIAKRKEVEEAQRRIAELEQTIAAQTKLLELQNVALAEEQKRAKDAVEKAEVEEGKVETAKNASVKVNDQVEKGSAATEYKVSLILGGSLTGLLAAWLWTRRRSKKDASLLEETNMTNIEPTAAFAPVMHSVENTFTLTPNKDITPATMATSIDLLVPLAEQVVIAEPTLGASDDTSTVTVTNDGNTTAENMNMLGEYTEIELDLAGLSEVQDSDTEVVLTTTALLGQEESVLALSTMATTGNVQTNEASIEAIANEDIGAPLFASDNSTVNVSDNDSVGLDFLDQHATMNVSGTTVHESTESISFSKVEPDAEEETELTFTLPNIVTEDKPLDPRKV